MHQQSIHTSTIAGAACSGGLAHAFIQLVPDTLQLCKQPFMLAGPHWSGGICIGSLAFLIGSLLQISRAAQAAGYMIG
jgi:hypothetical protein